MALTGSMRDFGISEILQLIGHQQKTGTLRVKDQSRNVSILFENGHIVDAHHEPYNEAFDLASMLVRSGMVSRKDMTFAQKKHKDTLKPLEHQLLEAGLISLEELRSMVSLANLEIIYSLFLWKDGDYSFEAGPVNYPHQWVEPISSEQVLMDGYRIKDEWPLIKKDIPDEKRKLEKVAGEFGPDDKLDDEQQRIYNLVDGERSINDLVYLARMGRFDVLKIIRELIGAGRVRMAEGEVEESARDFKGFLVKAAAVLAVLAGVAATGFGGMDVVKDRFLKEGHGADERNRQALWATYKRDRVANALSAYAAIEGRYPETLDALVEKGMVSKGDLSTALGSFSYEVENEGRTGRLFLSVPAPEEDTDSGQQE